MSFPIRTIILIVIFSSITLAVVSRIPRLRMLLMPIV